MRRFLAYVPFLTFWLLACSADDTGSGASIDVGGGSAAGSTAGGAGGTTAGTSGIGGGGSWVDGGTSTGTNVPSAGGPVQATGTRYQQDDTAMAGLDPATLDGLRAGGASCTANLLYPYEGTVFPAGLISPPFMWAGASDAAYVRVGYEASDVVDYQFATGPSSPGELRIPQDKWEQIAARAGTTSLVVKLSVKTGGTISTCERRVRIARGNMVGALYYNTYNHPSSGGVGAVLRLTLGQPEPQVYLTELLGVPPFGPCISCHSVSSNGSTLAASSHLYFPASFSARSYRTGADPQPPQMADIQDATFGAITPDGSRILRMGNPDCTQGANAFPRAKNNFPLALGPTQASMIDMTNGQSVNASGLDKDHYMWMPQFSPDGRHVVFNDAKPDGNGGTDRRELAVMDYDPTTGAFSNRRTIVSKAALNAQGVVDPSLDYQPNPVALAQLGGLIGGVYGADQCMSSTSPDVAAIPGGSCTGPCYPAWPFFTPDGKGVVFSLVSEPDFAVAFPGRDQASKSELWYVDLPSGKMMRMANANKGLKDGDAIANYYPTVLPVAVGGYFWVFWTSTRDFGHRNLDAPATAVASDVIFGSSSASQAFRKRIWVGAIRQSPGGELAGGIDSDPSTPGFYLEGQSETGNTRGFAALNPCMPSGSECTSGLDCCTGYCNVMDGAATGQCGEKISCAKTNEKCSTDSDCCPPAEGQPQNMCIGGFCNFIVLN